MKKKLDNNYIDQLLLHKSSNDDINDLYRRLYKTIKNFAINYHIGKCFAKLTNENISKKKLFYQDDLYGKLNIEFNYDISSLGTLTIYFYCLNDYTWDEKEILEITEFSKYVYFSYENILMLEEICSSKTKDVLTNVNNLNGFMQKANNNNYIQTHLLDYSLLFFNIKNFKVLNETYGMESGNEILQKYAAKIKMNLDSSELIGRLGGDNFIILAKNVHTKSLIKSLYRVTICLDTSNDIELLKIKSRIGIAKIENSKTIFNAIEQANVAVCLLKQKKYTDDVLMFKNEMNHQLTKQRRIKQNYAKALDEQEFVVYYQPKVDAQTNKLVGCEALVRWFKDGKLIPPSEFIPTLEQENLVKNLDFYVLEQVCKDINEWISMGIEPVKISTNFSREHIKRNDSINKIKKILNKYKIDKKYIEIELTETLSCQDKDKLLGFIKQLNELKISVAIDDFGTGYSSLCMIKDLNVNTIKIDKSFVDSFKTKKEQVVIENIVNMISELGFDSVIEGVESKEQLEYFKKINCNIIQGYFFDRPLCKKDFEKRLCHKEY